MRDHILRPRRAGTLSAAMLLLALAGCGMIGSGEDDAADPAAGAAAPAQAAAAAQPATAGPDTMHLSIDCQTPAEGLMTFRVNEAVFAVPPDQVRQIVPTGLEPPLQKDVVLQAIQARVAEGAGCPDKPFEVAALAVGGAAPDLLLEGTVALQPATPLLSDQIPGLMRELQQKQDANCQRNEAGKVMICAGRENLGDAQIPVVYVISTEPARRLNNGGPLAARCPLDQEGRPRSCDIIDDLPGGALLRAPLTAVPQTTETLAAAHQAALSRVGALRR